MSHRFLPFLLALLVAHLAVAETNDQQRQTPPYNRLTNGMALVEVQKTLGMPGRQVQETPAVAEAFYDFDFDGQWIRATVQTNPPPAVVKRIAWIKDGLTIEERQLYRKKEWPEWVAEQRRQTDAFVAQSSPVSLADAFFDGVHFGMTTSEVVKLKPSAVGLYMPNNVFCLMAINNRSGLRATTFTYHFINDELCGFQRSVQVHSNLFLLKDDFFEEQVHAILSNKFTQFGVQPVQRYSDGGGFSNVNVELWSNNSGTTAVIYLPSREESRLVYYRTNSLSISNFFILAVPEGDKKTTQGAAR